MLKLPKILRLFKKPDHISFLCGYASILIATLTESFEWKFSSVIFFTFTLIYEIYEISKGNRQIVKPDHIAFVIGFILILVTFWQDIQILLIIGSILFGFTLGYEIYSARKKDTENEKSKQA